MEPGDTAGVGMGPGEQRVAAIRPGPEAQAVFLVPRELLEAQPGERRGRGRFLAGALDVAGDPGLNRGREILEGDAVDHGAGLARGWPEPLLEPVRRLAPIHPRRDGAGGAA